MLNTKPHWVIGLRGYTVAGWCCLLLFMGASVGAFLAQQYPPIVIFLAFALLGLYLILGAGQFMLDEAGIVHQCHLGTFRILWQDVRRVEMGTQGTLVFYGDQQRFILAPAEYWSGEDKFTAYTFLVQKLKALGLQPFPCRSADYKSHKNVRI